MVVITTRMHYNALQTALATPSANLDPHKLLGSPKPGSAKPPVQLKLNKQNSPLVQLMQSVALERFDSRMRYLSSLREGKLDRILTAQNLVNARNYPASRSACDAAYNALKTYERDQRAITDGIPARVQSCGVSQNARECFLAGFNSTRSLDDHFLNQSLAIQRQQIDEVVATLNLIEPYAGKLTAKEDRLTFPKQEIADAFNDHVRNLHNLAITEKALQSQRQKSVQQPLERLASTIN